MAADGLRPGGFQEVQCSTQARQAVAVEGPGLQPGGIVLRLGLGIAVYPGASHQERPQLYTLPHAQAAGTLRAHEPLVAGKAHHADVLALHIDGKYPCRLGGIQYEQQAMTAAEIPHELDVCQITGKVGGVGAHHSLRIRPQQPFKSAVIQLAVFIRRDKIHCRPCCPQAVQGPQHGVVLPVRGDHMVSRPQCPGDGNVQRGGGVGGEGHPLRMLAAEELCRPAADAIHCAGGRQGLLMGAPAAVAVRLHGGYYRLRHAGGLGAGGGGVIQIDHGLMTFPAPASFSTMEYMLVTEPTASFSVRP